MTLDLGRHFDPGLCDRVPGSHRIGRNHHDLCPVDIGDVIDGDVGYVIHRTRIRDKRIEVVHDRGVVNISDIDIGDIHVARIGRAAVIPGHVGLTDAERKPGRHTSATDTDANRNIRTADECDQRRRIDRAHLTRPGYPAPSAAHNDPASIVKGCITPRRVVDPRVSPRCYVGPMSGAIRSPARINIRIPNRAILGFLYPAAIGIKVSIANHIGADVANCH